MRYLPVVIALALAASTAVVSEAVNQRRFTDVTSSSGLAVFRNLQGDAASKPHIVEVMGGGAAFLDYDNDGNLDVLLVRGSTVEKYGTGGSTVCSLFRGDGKGRFQDVTRESGLSKASGWGMGVAVADYDADGREDIYITGIGRNFLFRNAGDGLFEEVAAGAGVAGGRWSTGAAFADLDKDGDLDLYVANYLDYPLNPAPKPDPTCNYRGFPVFCGPRGLRGARDYLYINNGKGKFTDAAEALSIDTDKLYGLGVVIADIDNDTWPDIFVATDLAANLLYHNKGDGTFEETAIVSGAAFSEDGVEEGSMGVDFGDLNNDGWLDLYYTNSSYQTNTLLLNNRDGSFTNITNPARHGTSTYLYVGWGMAFADLDNDGWEDLFVVNGHLYPEADKFEMGLQYKQRALAFMNQRNETFRESGEELGLTGRWKSRGVAMGDYDNDGRVDVLINNLDDEPVLLHNEMDRRNHWVTIRCIGAGANRSAVGARVLVRTGAVQQIREIKAGTSYLSANDLRVHFGLGPSDRVDSVEVRWPSGRTQRIENIKADQQLTISEEK